MSATKKQDSIQRVSVIVPKNPFSPMELQDATHCLCALNVEKLMEWWPGKPHSPHRDSQKVRNIQRSLDWKRVVQIAAYLLQEEIIEAPLKLDKYFASIYEPVKLEPGREWPPRVKRVVGFQRSEFPTFSNVLLHVNGAQIEPVPKEPGVANLVFDEQDRKLNFSVIDGQHRINGAYFAIMLRKEQEPGENWDIPTEVFRDLDPAAGPPRRQAQIFIDVNFNQKKVDRSLVADLFPTARGDRTPLDDKERAQDLGRKLMLEIGPLVGMIQIPGIRFGTKDVITLATLNSAIEDQLEVLRDHGIDSLELQADFLAQVLSAWLEASGRFEDPKKVKGQGLEPQNVAYQGRILVSILTLIPAMILLLKEKDVHFVSEDAEAALTDWLRAVAKRAGLFVNGVFIGKAEFKERRYLGAGGIGRFRDTLWAAAVGTKSVASLDAADIERLAKENRASIRKKLGKACQA